MRNCSTGILFIVIGCLVLFFVAGYLCLWAGISQIINGVQAGPVSAGTIVGGVVRILATSFVAFVSAITITAGIIILELRRGKER